MEKKCEKCGRKLAFELESTVCNYCSALMIDEVRAKQSGQKISKKKPPAQIATRPLGISIFGVILAGVSLLLFAFQSFAGVFMFVALLTFLICLIGVVTGVRGNKGQEKKETSFYVAILVGSVGITIALTSFVFAIVFLFSNGYYNGY
ncbi:MAG: hypothetical protein FWC11_03540 [Firmicutes bacterium]|nr:hypothetical protein [Bacillota bacterium]MCL2255914.1 hypothetical protein [Bacillota bacterium]